MQPHLTDGEVRRALEQQRGVGYSMNLLDALINTMREEIKHEKETDALEADVE